MRRIKGLYTNHRDNSQYRPRSTDGEPYDDGWHGAAWSPDGTKIVFTRATGYENDPLIHIFGRNGRGQHDAAERR